MALKIKRQLPIDDWQERARNQNIPFTNLKKKLLRKEEKLTLY